VHYAPRSDTSAGLAEQGWWPLWVVDFPMFEWSAEDKRWDSLQSPFLPSRCDGHEDYARPGIPARALSKAYDIVLNGWVGWIRRRIGALSHIRQEVQSKVFRALGIERKKRRKKFGFLLEALQFGRAAPRRTWPLARPNRHHDWRAWSHP